MILFFDTETSGMVDFKAPDTSPTQPHLVQLAAMLCDHAGNVVAQFEFLVRPEGWEISKESEGIHGFSTEYCREHGFPLKMVLGAFNKVAHHSNRLVAYNISFDQKVMKSAYHRSEVQPFDYLGDKEMLCAMRPLPQICKVPNVGKAGYKWPTLSEAHRHFFGCEFDGAHGAMSDTAAMKRVWFEARRREGAT